MDAVYYNMGTMIIGPLIPAVFQLSILHRTCINYVTYTNSYNFICDKIHIRYTIQ